MKKKRNLHANQDSVGGVIMMSEDAAATIAELLNQDGFETEITVATNAVDQKAYICTAARAVDQSLPTREAIKARFGDIIAPYCFMGDLTECDEIDHHRVRGGDDDREFDFTLFVSTEEAVRNVAQSLRKDGFSVEIDESGGLYCRATKRIEKDEQTRDALKRKLETLVASVCGERDGPGISGTGDDE